MVALGADGDRDPTLEGRHVKYEYTAAELSESARACRADAPGLGIDSTGRLAPKRIRDEGGAVLESLLFARVSD